MDIQEHRNKITEFALKFFPYATPNPGQLEAIVEAVRLFQIGTKHVIIQAPTGIGKTAIATTVHKVLKAMSTDRWRTTIITATKGLQDQYVQDDKEIFDLKGTSNYGCAYGKAPYNSASCSTQVKRGQCRPKNECPYVIRRIQWSTKADLRLTNSSFQISAPPEIVMGSVNEANLIVLDECHEIDDKIIDHSTINFYSPKFKRLAEFGFDGITEKLQGLSDYLFSKHQLGIPYELDESDMAQIKYVQDSAVSIFEELDIMHEQHTRKDHEAVGMARSMILELVGSLDSLLNCLDGSWINNAFESGSKLDIKPVYASQMAEYALFRKAKQFLHMSATICGAEEYTNTLGITDYQYIEIPNPIPVKNRPVFYLGKIKVSGAVDYKEMAGYIDKLLDLHKDENGIIHTVSLALANEIYNHSNNKSRMLVSKDRVEILQELSAVKKGRVILSPSIETGLDFKGDMSRFQIIAKVPYLYLGDPLIALNAKRRSWFYARKAVLRMVQACGRSIRGVTDHAKTYIIDSNFARLYDQNTHLFPTWFQDSVRG